MRVGIFLFLKYDSKAEVLSSPAEEMEVKRGFITALYACLLVTVIGVFQVLIVQIQTGSLAGNVSPSRVGWIWKPEEWEADLWTGPNKWHDYSFNSDFAYTRFAGWNGINSWGNTEYEQGRDPWQTYGLPTKAIPLVSAQQVTARLRIVEAKVDNKLGAASAYIDLWVNFSGPVGEKGLRWAELIVYLKTEKGALYSFQDQDSFSNRICTDGNLTWYMVGYRCLDADVEWSTRTIDINQLITQLADVYGVDISKGTVSCLTFGVEGAQGEIAAEWNYLKYKHD